MSNGKRCVQPFDCGSQFKCVDGRCVPVPDCGIDNNGCQPEDPLGECFGPQPIPGPDPDVPTCGIGDPFVQEFEIKDCVFNCNLFCDEWEKVSANLTSDSEIKDCKPDDACSACKSCQPGPDSPDEKAIRDAYDLLIQDTKDEKEAREEEQEQEVKDLRDQKDESLDLIKGNISDANDEIDRLNGEIADLRENNTSIRNDITEINQEIAELSANNPNGENDAQIDALEAQREALNGQIDTNENQITFLQGEISYQRELINFYRGEAIDINSQFNSDLRDLQDRHDDELDVYDDQIQAYRDERDARIEKTKNRGVCKHKKVPERPCYCPAYVDEDTGKIVNDGANRECYLCNTDNGQWEYRDDLCTLTCEQCVICDNGEERCATTTLPESQANDICARAKREALGKCKALEPAPERCPYPKPACQVEGPVTNANFSADVNEQAELEILQTGSSALDSNNGIISYINVDIDSEATGLYRLYILPDSNVNGGSNRLLLGSSAVLRISGSNERPEVPLQGKPKMIGTFQVYETINGDTTEVISDDGEQATYEYRWFADGAPLYWSEARYPVDPETGTQYNPGGKYAGVDMLLEEQSLLLAPEDEGKIIELGVRVVLAEPDEFNEQRELVYSSLSTPVDPAPFDTTQGSISIFGAPDENTYSALVVDLTELEQLYYPKYFPILIDWIAADTGSSVGAEQHLYLREWAEGRIIYAVATVIDSEGNSTPFISNSIGPISAGGPPEGDPSLGSSTVSVSLSTGSPIQNQPVSVSGSWSLANGLSSGPFYNWYVNENLIYGAFSRNYTPDQDDVNNYLQGGITVYDRYGTPFSDTSSLGDPVENVPSVHTGHAWIIGPDEPSENATLTVFTNIEDEDGLSEGKEGKRGGLQYQWLADGFAIEGAVQTTLKLLPALSLVDKEISCIVFWTTDFGVEKQVRTRSTKPVRPSGGNLTLYVEDDLELEKGVRKSIPVRLRGDDPGTTDSAVSVTTLYSKFRLVSTGGSGMQFTGINDNLAAALPGPLALANWDDDEGLEDTCEEGWDCFSTTVDPNGGGTAPLGSKYIHRCPYPGYPELTYEQSLESDCKSLCQDYCYDWSITLTDGEPTPVLDDNTIIQSVWETDGKVIYGLRTCAPHPNPDSCPPNFEKNYLSIWRVQTPEINVWRCSCEEPLGETFSIKSAVEWSVSVPGMGPWKLDPEWGDIYPICGDESYRPLPPPEDIQGGFLPDFECTPFPIVYLGCAYDFNPVSEVAEICSRRGLNIQSFIRKGSFCGTGGKPNPQRGFFIEDANGKVNIQYHGYTMWPFVYRTWLINMILDTEQFQTTALGWRPPLNNPGVPADSLPPPCVEAPTQVAYYSIADNTFYSTLATYKEIVGEAWYKCVVEGSDDEICEECIEVGLGQCEYDPEFTIPINLGFVRGARFQELQEGDELYAGGVGALKPPGIPKRDPLDNEKTPAVTGPASASYSDATNRVVAQMNGTINGDEAPLQSWRFSSNKGAQDPTGLFSINQAGLITARTGQTPPGAYSLGVQARFGELWSKTFTIIVSVS